MQSQESLGNKPIRKNAALYNNIGHVLKTHKGPIAIPEIQSNPAVFSLAKHYVNVADVVKWYHSRGFVTRMMSTNGRSRWEWQWKDEQLDVPDHKAMGMKHVFKPLSERQLALPLSGPKVARKKRRYVRKSLFNKPRQVKAASPMIQIAKDSAIASQERAAKYWELYKEGVKFTAQDVDVMIRLAALATGMPTA